MAARTKRFSAYVYCRECLTESDVYYTATWNDPIIRKLAIAKAGWRQVAGTLTYLCAGCVEAHDQ